MDPETTPLGAGASPVMCNVCGYVLNSYHPADPREPVRYEHPHVAPDDHQPDPVPMLPGAREVCDFCADPDPVWWYYGKEITAIIPALADKRTYSPIWAACRRCAVHVDRRDVKGMSRHLLRVMADTEMVRDNPAMMREMWESIHEVFLASWYKRERIPTA